MARTSRPLQVLSLQHLDMARYQEHDRPSQRFMRTESTSRSHFTIFSRNRKWMLHVSKMLGVCVNDTVVSQLHQQVVAARRSNIKPKNVEMIPVFRQEPRVTVVLLILVMALCTDFNFLGNYRVWYCIASYHVNTQYRIESSIAGIAHL